MRDINLKKKMWQSTTFQGSSFFNITVLLYFSHLELKWFYKEPFSIISSLFFQKPRGFHFSSRMAIGHRIALTYSLYPKLCQPQQGHFASSTDIKKRTIYLVIVEWRLNVGTWLRSIAMALIWPCVKHLRQI